MYLLNQLVLSVPDDNIVFSKLTSLQVDVYKAILNHPDMKLILSMEDPCQCGSQKPQVKCCHQVKTRIQVSEIPYYIP